MHAWGWCMSSIFHIAKESLYAEAVVTGHYTPPDFAEEGFVHCSYAGQVKSVADARYRGRTDLVLLEIDVTRLGKPVIDENLEGGSELFPHVYETISLTAVTQVHGFPCNAIDGSFELPNSVLV